MENDTTTYQAALDAIYESIRAALALDEPTKKTEGEVRYEVEYTRNMYNRHPAAAREIWRPAHLVLGGVLRDYRREDDAQRVIDRMVAIARVDPWFRGVNFRIVKVTREAVSA